MIYSSMIEALNMKAQRLYVPLLLLTIGLPNSVHASCEIFSSALKNLNAEEKESLKQVRRQHVEQRCGSQSQSWIGGAAGSRRFEYLNCKLSARNSDTFKTKWATQAAGWQTKKEQLEMKRIASGCDKN